MEVKKVAILGAGNGGLTAAADLAERGFDISLYTAPTREYQFEGLGFFHLQQYICLIKFSSNVTDFMIEYLRNFDFIFL